MYVNRINLKNYRNYSHLEIELSPGFNVMYGENGQGKTNILEAVFLCAAGRSHRTVRDTDLVEFGREEYRVEIGLVREDREGTVEVAYRKDESKKVKINGVLQNRIGGLIGHLNAVMFSPEDLMIVKEGPSERRRFADISISQQKPAYFHDLQQYAKILSHRNALLKEIQFKRHLIDTMDVWNGRIAAVGAKIMKERRMFAKKLSGEACKNHMRITGGKEEIQIGYAPSLHMEETESEANNSETKNIEKAILDYMEKNIEREICKGTTLAGPHRDDYEIMLDNRSIRQYGSQGQQRTAMLSIKLSEIEIMKETAGEYPVLLLDDVMSELDSQRQEYLFQSLKKIQTFVTCTDKRLFEERNGLSASYYNVVRGRVDLHTGHN